MSGKYDGTYVKTANDPTFWKVDHGERLKVHSLDELQNKYGLRLLRVVSQDELDAIPLAKESTDAPPNTPVGKTGVLNFGDGIDAGEASAAKPEPAKSRK